MTSERTGILGGRFDPVHLGHLATAALARRELALDRVLLLPSGPSPHRAALARAADADRLEMTRLMAETVSWLDVEDAEIRSAEPSYTSVTLGKLAEAGHQPTRLFFIVGADAFADIATWHDYPAVFDRAHFAVVSRPGHPVDALRRRLPTLATRMRVATPVHTPALTIHLLDAETPAISSTAIRVRLQAGQSVDDLVPEPVAAYISTHGLYRAPSGE